MNIKKSDKETSDSIVFVNKYCHYILLTILTSASFLGLPCAYLIGLAFYQGEMETYGVMPQFFSLSFEDVYLNAYIAIGMILPDFTTFIFELLEKTIVLILIIILLVKIFSWASKLWFLKLHENNNFNFGYKLFDSFARRKKTFSRSVFFVLLLCSFILLPWAWINLPKLAIKEGEKIAYKYIEAGCGFDTDSSSSWNKCVSIMDKNNKLISEGIFIAKNDTFIAIYTNDSSVLIKSDDVRSIIRVRKVTKAINKG